MFELHPERNKFMRKIINVNIDSLNILILIINSTIIEILPFDTNLQFKYPGIPFFSTFLKKIYISSIYSSFLQRQSWKTSMFSKGTYYGNKYINFFSKFVNKPVDIPTVTIDKINDIDIDIHLKQKNIPEANVVTFNNNIDIYPEIVNKPIIIHYYPDIS